MRSFFRTLISLSVVHWVTGVGVVLTTASAAVFLVFVFQRFDNPYIGIIIFLIIPAFFTLGLILMPLGVTLAARRAGGYSQLIAHLPPSGPQLRRLGWAIAFATLANASILTAAAYHGVAVMDSTQFCGETCHSVMNPQYVRYQQSPHGRVACVDCHIGTGAASFVEYKLAGVRQLIRLTTNTYHRPIPPPMDRMRPATVICEQCHSLQTMNEDIIAPATISRRPRRQWTRRFPTADWIARNLLRTAMRLRRCKENCRSGNNRSWCSRFTERMFFPE
jgi:hypothetical protein